MSFLDADAHTVRACFALREGHPDQCVMIDRHSSQIARDPSPPAKPAKLVHLAPGAASITPMDEDIDSFCVNDRCVRVLHAPVPLPDDAQASISDDGLIAVATIPPSSRHPEPRFTFLPGRDNPGPTAEFSLKNSDTCGSAVMLHRSALVETNDCSGTGGAYLYGMRGNLLGPLVDRPDFNAFGAWPVDLGNGRWAVVAPAEYAVVLLDVPTSGGREIVDLVPIQAESTPTPTFVETHGGDSTWVIASPTGGVGIIDLARAALANAWIIPRCDSARTVREDPLRQAPNESVEGKQHPDPI